MSPLGISHNPGVAAAPSGTVSPAPKMVGSFRGRTVTLVKAALGHQGARLEKLTRRLDKLNERLTPNNSLRDIDNALGKIRLMQEKITHKKAGNEKHLAPALAFSGHCIDSLATGQRIVTAFKISATEKSNAEACKFINRLLAAPSDKLPAVRPNAVQMAATQQQEETKWADFRIKHAIRDAVRNHNTFRSHSRA